MTPDAAEEARAQLYRDQAARRVQYQTSLWYSLAGPPAAYQEFNARWQPLVDWLAERDLPPVDSKDEIDPLGQSDTVNVGR